MCVVSMVMDQGLNWPRKYWEQPYVPDIFTDLVKKAKEYDEKTGQKDCELMEKKAKLLDLAKELGVTISFD